ncbi:MAG: sugar ABC transporter permease [Chloroflexota bacterium]|nr:sugar ABC transporter permease [Chloroflexota bacterium]
MTAFVHRIARQERVLSPWLREALFGYLCLVPWIVGFLVFTAGPMFASLGFSLFRTDFLNTARFIGLKWYEDILFTDRLATKALVNTAYYAFAMVPLSTALALGIAVLLNQGIKFQGLWRTIYYLPSVVSGVAVSLLWRWLYQPEMGLINSLLANVGIKGPRWIYSETWAMPSLIIMALWGSGGAMLIFLAGLRGIPTSLYEAAEMDGAGPFRSFWNITLPMLTPTILFNMVMSTIGSFQVFTQAFVLTEGGPNNATLTMVLYIYRKAFEQMYFGYGSALAWALFIVVLVFSILALRSSRLWVFYAGE